MSEEATKREYVEPRLQELGSAKDVVSGTGIPGADALTVSV
jgi:hypothetical protein